MAGGSGGPAAEASLVKTSFLPVTTSWRGQTRGCTSYQVELRGRNTHGDACIHGQIGRRTSKVRRPSGLCHNSKCPFRIFCLSRRLSASPSPKLHHHPRCCPPCSLSSRRNTSGGDGSEVGTGGWNPFRSPSQKISNLAPREDPGPVHICNSVLVTIILFTLVQNTCLELSTIN